jgi:integrase
MGARRFRKVASSTRYNNTLAGLGHVFDVAVEAGIIYGNPGAKLERVPVRQKQHTLPSRDAFLRLVDAVESAGAWCSRDCADLLRGLAFTGCRQGEATQIEWRDVDLEAGEIIVRGDAETETKNWTVRRVPMIPDARVLFQRMREERASESLTEKVFRVREAQRAIDRAARKVGIERIVHHDLRHLFATICVESGVDIPTVSRWLGHKDGGALAMKTYSHLRREHSIAQAQDPVYPVSKGHHRHQALKGYAVVNACTEPNTARKRRWNLVRELKGLESRIGRPLEMAEVLLSFDEWHRRSLPFLDSAKTRDDYLAAFLGELGKIRVPWGEGETLRKEMENVSKLSLDQLPAIPAVPNPPETSRRLLSLHRELSRLSANGIYFLSYRDAAEISGVTHQTAHTITAALVTLGAIKIVNKGKAGLNSRKAAEFRYLLSEGDNSAQADQGREVEI